MTDLERRLVASMLESADLLEEWVGEGGLPARSRSRADRRSPRSACSPAQYAPRASDRDPSRPAPA